MADPPYYMDPGSSDGSTEADKWEYVKGSIDQRHGLVPLLLDASSKLLDKVRDVKDSIKSPPSHFGTTQKKFINMLTTRAITGINTEFQRKLDLSGCGLTMLPEGIRDLPNLEELNLSNNPLNHSFPSWFRHLKLRKLDLSGCGLATFPEGIWDLHSNLEELNLSNNPLNHSFPFWFYHFKLRKLDLSGCGLTMLPEGIWDLPNLEELNLSNNPLNHSFPSWFRHLKLRKLDLSGCGLTMLPEGIRDLPNLEELNLSNNPLNHSFRFWYRHYMLRKLDLSGCGLTMLPEGIEDLPNLEELNLSNNPLNHSFPFLYCHYKLRKLDLSGCGLKEWPEGLKLDHWYKLLELNLSNNLFDHRNLLEKLNRKEFHSSKCGHSRIIFEDAIYTQSGTVWKMEVREDASMPVSTETWLDEFCRIRKSEKLTIETYHSMLESLKILVTLLGDNEEFFLKQELTLDRCFFEILHYLNNIEKMIDSRGSTEDDRHWHNAGFATYYLKKAVEGLTNGTTTRDEAIKNCSTAFKKAFEASSDTLSVNNGLLVAKLKIISKIMSKLTKPEAAILDCLQSLQELHDLHAVRVVFSNLKNEDAAKSVVKMNKILFKFVQEFFRPPPTVEEWPATIKLLNERIYNPLFDGQFLDEGLMHAEKAVLRKTKLGIGEVGNKVQDPVSNVAEYSFTISESCEQTPDNSITVDQKGGCFSLPEVCAFLLFPPNAVDEKVTLKCSRRKHKECQGSLRNGEAFVSRILKIEPEGVTFKKPVTVLLCHSLDEDQDFLYFYELIVKNLSPTGCQEFQTEAISCTEDVPKEISNKEILNDYLPLAKATIQETCTLAAATRARFSQILIPTNRRYVFSKQYGDVAELKITFPAGVTEKIRSLTVQLFPVDTVVNKEIILNKSLVCAPIIRVSGQTTPFLKAVGVELTYSHSDVANIEEEFLPVGKTTEVTTDYGLLLQNHNETEPKSNWQALNKSNDVSIERTGMEQLKLSFSVKHFSDVQPIVKTSAVSHVPPTNSGMVNMNNPACHHAIVLAVHEAGGNPKTLRAILAPKLVKRRLYCKWKVEALRFMNRLKCEEPVYFCVPMSDTTESDHLLLKDYTLWFDPDDESELANNTIDGVDLRGKHMRFLKDEKCNNGENHTTQGNCRAKFPIHISESLSVQADTESHEVVHGEESPKGSNVQPDEEDTQKDSNKIMMRRCELFEKTIETTAQKKLDIIAAFVKDPKTGKATESANVTGSIATVMFSLAGGITIAVGAATFGAASFAAALVAGVILVVKFVDKTLKQANAKRVANIIEVNAEDKKRMSCYLKCVVKDVAKELSRIFESQIFELQSDKQVEILAESAVELMLDLDKKKEDTFDRDTLLKKVLQDGKMKKKKDLLTSDNNMKWSAPDVFRKPGLRRIIFGKNGMEFKYSVKSENACDPSKYGYRGQFLELKTYDSKKNCETSSTDETDENQEICCEDCSSNLENHTSDRYFSESEIDTEYTEPQPDKPYAYCPLHILVQCPNVFHSFKQDLERVSFQEFLKKKSSLPEQHFVRPVYRSHSPVNISNLQNANLTETDFSHANLTKTILQECNFSRCVMLFANLQEAKMSGSTFCDTFINYSNLKKVVAERCYWTKTSLLNSRVDGARMWGVKPTFSDNCFDGTNITSDNIRKKDTENCNEEEPPQTMMSGSNSSASLVSDQNLVETRRAWNRDGTYREPVQPAKSVNGTNMCNNNAGNPREFQRNETRV